MFSSVFRLFVCLFVCQRDYAKKLYLTDFHRIRSWEGDTWAEGKPLNFGELGSRLVRVRVGVRLGWADTDPQSTLHGWTCVSRCVFNCNNFVTAAVLERYAPC